jgi:hypothetical protein
MNSDISPSAFSFAAPENLRVNMLASAYGVPRSAPSFSWVMHSGETGDIQTSYRILIAKRLEDMREGDYLLDTGWTATDENSNVTLAGLDTLLKDNELYYWAVRLRNKSGAESALSEPMPFTTAPGKEWEDTRGIWCRPDNSPADFCLLRTEFKVPDLADVECAVLSMTAASPEPTRRHVYTAYLNGTLVGLGPSRIGKDIGGEGLLYYNSYNVTELLSNHINHPIRQMHYLFAISLIETMMEIR